MQPLGQQDPQRIGNYVLIGRLGSGGMGQVFLGRSPGGRRVAVKVIHEALARDEQFRLRFQREVRAAQLVCGLYTAEVVAADPEATLPWMATRYIDGPCLAEAVETGGPLPLDAVLALGAGIAEALNAIQRAGLVHRDLKPSNVVMGPDGPHVIDFGIAKALDTTTVLTNTSLTVGTCGYMSPEQILGKDVRIPTDIFALGAVLYFAATGEPLFGVGHPATLAYRIVHDEPDLTEIADPALRGLLESCLDKNPDRRPTPVDVLQICSPTIDLRSDPAGTPDSRPNRAAQDSTAMEAAARAGSMNGTDTALTDERPTVLNTPADEPPTVLNTPADEPPTVLNTPADEPPTVLGTPSGEPRNASDRRRPDHGPAPLPAAVFRARKWQLALRWVPMIIVGVPALCLTGALAWSPDGNGGDFDSIYGPGSSTTTVYLEVATASQLYGVLVSAAVAGLALTLGLGVLARVTTHRTLRVTSEGIQAETGPTTWVRLIPPAALTLLATALFVGSWIFHEPENGIDNSCSPDSSYCSVYVNAYDVAHLAVDLLRLLVVAGVIVGIQWFRQEFRRLTLRYRRLLRGEVKHGEGESMVIYRWHEITDVRIRRVGWRRTRTLLATPAPSVTLSGNPAVVSTYSPGLGAFRVFDLGGHAMPVHEVMNTIEKYLSGRQDGAPIVRV